MALTAISTAETAGTTHRELSDDEVLKVLVKEGKKRREASAAYTGAGRPELAAREDAEFAVLEGYLPTQLTDEEIAALVAQAAVSYTHLDVYKRQVRCNSARCCSLVMARSHG